eukprot:Gregarina_sp_Poly_1__10451@NODE_759_length_6404_cov_52_217611_g560_i0_p1_GENE_NODE_759_length_6404_cov_52_217611_g560_i0NODE_759_length_6404_cov_52_217611_g560_i0_p1_ORF_typecomplete_len962_score139_08FUSC/PF04632_12/2_1e02FUSC/PF04632_12/8_7e15FUSC/PF04632_12/2_2e03ALMT/PF11744_8/2e11FUSC_2/PF13515_6/2_4e11ArAE_2_N/PF10337_9/0_0048ArAE_1/PF06081_11/3_2e03ArAE_1/PF06081_11/0_025_NODE_759_length_6404_cov_52_217611_g560_i022805165
MVKALASSISLQCRRMTPLVSLCAVEYLFFAPVGINNLRECKALLADVESVTAHTHFLAKQVEVPNTFQLWMCASLGTATANQQTASHLLRRISLLSLSLQQSIEWAASVKPALLTASSQARLSRQMHHTIMDQMASINSSAEALEPLFRANADTPGDAFDFAHFLALFLSTFVESTLQLGISALRNLDQQRRRSVRAFAFSTASLLAPIAASYAVLVSLPISRTNVPTTPLVEDRHSEIPGLNETLDEPDAPKAVLGTARFFSRRERHQFQDKFAFRGRLRFAVGSTLTLAFILCADRWANLRFTNDPPSSIFLNSSTFARLAEAGVSIHADLLLKGPLGGWTFLGFLVCFALSWQSTLKRAVVRLTGIALACLNAWLCLRACGEHEWGHYVWLTITIFIATWIYVSPSNPWIAAHPHWGYAGQVFTYTSTILVVEAHLGEAGPNEIVLQRFCGQLVGASFAVVCSLLVFPVSVDRAIRVNVADQLPAVSDTLAALCHLGCAPLSALVESAPTGTPTPTAHQWISFASHRLADWRKHADVAQLFENDNEVLANLPRLRTPPHWRKVSDSLRRLRLLREQALFRVSAAAEAERRALESVPFCKFRTEPAVSDNSVSVYQDFRDTVTTHAASPLFAVTHTTGTPPPDPLFLPLQFSPPRTSRDDTVSNVSPGYSRFLDALENRRNLSTPGHGSVSPVHRVASPASHRLDAAPTAPTPLSDSPKSRYKLRSLRISRKFETYIAVFAEETVTTFQSDQSATLNQIQPPATETGTQTSRVNMVERSTSVTSLIQGQATPAPPAPGLQVSFALRQKGSFETRDASDSPVDLSETAEILIVLRALRRVAVLLEWGIDHPRSRQPELSTATEFLQHCDSILGWCASKLSVAGAATALTVSTLAEQSIFGKEKSLRGATLESSHAVSPSAQRRQAKLASRRRALCVLHYLQVEIDAYRELAFIIAECLP